jgi:DNA-binding FadR family transcriptional regulator
LRLIEQPTVVGSVRESSGSFGDLLLLFASECVKGAEQNDEAKGRADQRKDDDEELKEVADSHDAVVNAIREDVLDARGEAVNVVFESIKKRTLNHERPHPMIPRIGNWKAQTL